MSNLPTRQALDQSTATIPAPKPLPRDYRVTGTVPPTYVQPRVAKAGIEPSTLIWIALGLHGVIFALEIYAAYKAGLLRAQQQPVVLRT